MELSGNLHSFISLLIHLFIVSHTRNSVIYGNSFLGSMHDKVNSCAVVHFPPNKKNREWIEMYELARVCNYISCVIQSVGLY